MATIPDFIDALAPVTGVHPASLERYMRVLTDAGKIRKSKQGGGRGAVHLDHIEAATVLLGLAAAVPSAAAAAVDALAPLRRAHLPASSVGLLATLASTLHNRAVQLAYNPEQAPEIRGWKLRLRVAPAAAWMIWTNAEGVESREDFVAAVPDLANTDRGVRREAVITTEVLDAGARLVADTLSQTNSIPPVETRNAAPARAALQDGVDPMMGRHRSARDHHHEVSHPHRADLSVCVSPGATAKPAGLPAPSP